MYSRDQIRTVHLEVTTHCNASCPQCPRNQDGGARNPNLPLTQLTLRDIEKIFPCRELPALNTVQVCGNYGDAVMAREFIPIARHLKSLYPGLAITVATNGSLRPIEWWTELAGVVDRCTFGIDGLADTHALYRQGTEFHTIIDNARAFISAGGKAEWAFLVFRHNQHQVDDAFRLSRELGFDRFSAKATSRFYEEGHKLASTPVRDRNGAIMHRLEATDCPGLANTELDRMDRMVLEDPERFADYVRNTSIDCKAITRGKLYISGEGHAFPCCWLGNIYAPDRPWQDTEIGRAIEASGGLDRLDAKRHGLGVILDGDFFTKAVPAGWSPGDARLTMCSKMCGEIDMNLAQYVDHQPPEECLA